jgi:beta-glucosidase
MTDQIAGVDAVVAAWLPGSEGAGLADVLFGDKPFTGKLPLAWPVSVQQDTPLYNRGFGLTTHSGN